MYVRRGVYSDCTAMVAQWQISRINSCHTSRSDESECLRVRGTYFVYGATTSDKRHLCRRREHTGIGVSGECASALTWVCDLGLGEGERPNSAPPMARRARGMTGFGAHNFVLRCLFLSGWHSDYPARTALRQRVRARSRVDFSLI